MSGTRHSRGESPFDAVVIVGSQGGLAAFQSILGCLPATFPAPVLLDLHRAPAERFTEDLLRRSGVLVVRPATDGLAPRDATVYLGPAEGQLLITDERRLAIVEPVDGCLWHRAADAFLRSAAEAYGPWLVAVVLSGRLDGGAQGIRDIKRAGGRVLVQDPSTAPAPWMPIAALATGCVDFALPPQALGQALVAMCTVPGAAELFRVRLNAGVRG